MKRMFFVIFIISVTSANAQECTCGERTTIAFHEIEWLGIQKPDDPVLLEQWQKLEILWSETDFQFDQQFKSNKCLDVRQVGPGTQHGDVAVFNYRIYGSITRDESDYILKLWLQPSCSDKILAESQVAFQLYPVIDVDRITEQAVANFGHIMEVIQEYEYDERHSKDAGRGGDLWGGRIEIAIDNKMVKGEETRAVFRVVDCDGLVLKNKEISTDGTSGGIFTPSKFKTDNEGNAIAKFRMLTDKIAFIKASCETKNVWGCQDFYTGTEAVKGIAGSPIKVSINYSQFETRTTKRATLPGVKVTGGEEAELTDMGHRSVLYYFPSAKDLKDGILVDAEKERAHIGLSGKEPGPDVQTIYVTEYGYYYFAKTVANAKISAMAGNVEMVQAEEKGSDEVQYGYANLEHPSEVMFTLGNKNEPASFMWMVQYPANGENMAGGGATIVKGEEGVKWKVNKITDPKSIYKTEYLLSLTLDAAEEFKKGSKGMKELFGFDADDLTKMIDPTNPQSGMAGASGTQVIDVRILSPYPDK
jgi:hypothetical protein